MLTLMSSSVSHEMITPIKCIIEMASQMQKKFNDPSLRYDTDLVMNTASMLLNQVKGTLDKNLLDKNLL